MPKLTASDVKKIANLSRLGLNPEEVEQAAQDLAGVLNHFSKLQAVDTKGTPTSDDVTGLTNVTRADEAQPDILSSPAELLKRAPDTQDAHIKVKAVFEERSVP